MSMYTCVQVTEEPRGVRSPETGNLGSCEWANMGAGNSTQIFCEISLHS